ncbi:MAG: CofH family radical SAM protein [Bacteroidales bacterium]
MLNKIYKKAVEQEDLTLEEAVFLFENAPLYKLMEIAQQIRFMHVPQKKVSWQIDRNVNYTNVCVSGCIFCNFHCKISEKEREQTVTLEEYREKIKILKEQGGNQLLLQGGLHPKYDINYYRTLFKELKKMEPTLKLNALGPPEIAHIARLSNLTYKETLTQLVTAGLDTLPGAGAEILSNRVRKILSPAKPTATQWIEVMKEAHKLGMSTTATMVYGHIETNVERMQHLIILRNIQKLKPINAPGFRAFICWPMQTKGTKLEQLYPNIKRQTPADYIRMITMSRIILNNIPHIQVSWLTVGAETAKICLHAGADDMGSIMIEENVMSSAGAHNSLDKKSIQETIIDAGFTPWLRDQQYNIYNH